MLRFGALPTLRPAERAYVDAFHFAEATAFDPDAEPLPIPSANHLSSASKKRVRTYLSEELRLAALEWEAETGTPFFLTTTD